MRTWKELLTLARKAIEDGDLEAAEKYKNQAKALKDIEALDPAEEPTPVTETTEYKALEAKLDELNARWEKIENDETPVNENPGHVTVTKDETDKKAEQPFKSFGEQLRAVYNAAVYPGRMDNRLAAQAKTGKTILGLSEQVPSDGGFLVQQDFASDLLRPMHETAVLASRCRRVPIGANSNGLKINAVNETSRATGSRWGGVQGYWIAEGNAPTAADPTFRQMSLDLKKLAGLAYATDELLADTTALESVISQAIREELEFLLDDAILNGDGAGKPLGILNGPAVVSVAKESGQAAATLVVENIFNMYARMWARSLPNAVWLINQDVLPQLFGLEMPVGTGGVPAYLPPGGLSQSPYGTLMGRPLIPTEFNATVGTVGDIVLVDFSQYLLIDKGGIDAASSIHVQFLTAQTAYRFIYRVDGQPIWNSALTPFKGSNTLSPYITLATRA